MDFSLLDEHCNVTRRVNFSFYKDLQKFSTTEEFFSFVSLHVKIWLYTFRNIWFPTFSGLTVGPIVGPILIFVNPLFSDLMDTDLRRYTSRVENLSSLVYIKKVRFRSLNINRIKVRL